MRRRAIGKQPPRGCVFLCLLVPEQEKECTGTPSRNNAHTEHHRLEHCLPDLDPRQLMRLSCRRTRHRTHHSIHSHSSCCPTWHTWTLTQHRKWPHTSHMPQTCQRCAYIPDNDADGGAISKALGSLKNMYAVEMSDQYNKDESWWWRLPRQQPWLIWFFYSHHQCPLLLFWLLFVMSFPLSDAWFGESVHFASSR